MYTVTVKAYLVPVLAIAMVVLATALLILLTPIRHLPLVPPTMHEIDPRAFYEKFSAHPDDFIFIDVRSPSIYASAHAKGAISIPIENLYDDHQVLPRDGKQIALICTTGRLAAIAYGYLENQGFTNLLHVEGGMINWTAEGLPVEGKSIDRISTSTPDEHQ